MRNVMWVGGGITGIGKIPMLGGTSKTFDQLIKSLFANNEQGFVYDPNDLSTMFQDAVGTVPVTDAGQPVGLMLDKSKGLRIGSELLTNGDFSNGLAGWTANSPSFIRLNGVVDGKAELEVVAGASGHTGISSPINTVVGKWYVASCDVISYAYNSAFISLESGGLIGNKIYGAGKSVLIFRATSVTTTIRCAVSLDNEAVGQKYYFGNVSVKELSGNHAYQTTSASRPILRQNAVTGAYYLEFDGSDDFLVTNSIDFTTTDEVSLFTGVRKLSDATIGIVAELSTTGFGTVGSFYLSAPTIAGVGSFGVYSRGTLQPSSSASAQVYTAPISAIISASGSIAASKASIRVNNGANTINLQNQGTGNYGNYPLYIGRRGGSLYPYNGHIYSLIGVGRLTTASETVSIEKELAKRVGVTLNV